METISNPEVVSALRQDKQHNLTYLKENHGVRPPLSFSLSLPRRPTYTSHRASY